MSNTPIWQRNVASRTQPNQPANQPQVPEIAIEVEIPAIKKVLRFSAEDLTRQWNLPPNRALFWLEAKDTIHESMKDSASRIVDVLRNTAGMRHDFNYVRGRLETELNSLEQRIKPQAFTQQTVTKLRKAYKSTARQEAALAVNTAISPVCNTIRAFAGDVTAVPAAVSDYLNIAAVCVRAGLSMRRKLDLLLKSIIFWILKHYELSDSTKRELKSLNLFNPKKVLGFDTFQKICEALGNELKSKNAHRLKAEAGVLAAAREWIPGMKFDMIWNATPSSIATILQALHFRHDKYGRLLALYLKKYGADLDPEEAENILKRRFYDPVLARVITFGHAIEKYTFYGKLLPALDQIVGQLSEKTNLVEFAVGTFASLAKSFIPTSSVSGPMDYVNNVIGFDFQHPLVGIMQFIGAVGDLPFMIKDGVELIKSEDEQDNREHPLDMQELADAEGLTKCQDRLEMEKEVQSFLVSHWLGGCARYLAAMTLHGWKITLSSAPRVATGVTIGDQRGRAQLTQARRDWPVLPDRRSPVPPGRAQLTQARRDWPVRKS
jgi:hypothetical protein